MSGTIQASIVKDSASSTNNLALDSSGNVTVGNNLTVSGTGVLNIGSGQIYKDASGNIGIGVTPSNSQLKVIEGTYGAFTGQSQLNITANAYYNSGWKYIGTGYANQYFIDRSVGAHVWNYAASGSAGGTISFSEAMRIDASGNVGIGTTSPATYGKLAVNGNICPIAAPSSSWGVDFASTSSAGNYITLANNATYDIAAGSGFIYLYEDAGNGAAQIACVYGNTPIIWQSSSLFTSVSGTAGKVNVSYNSGVTRYRIQNLYGSTIYLWLSTFRMRANV